MKRKTKLIATLMAMCLVITLGVFGILAVKTLNMSVGGNITFNAEGLDFSISDGTFETTAGAAYPGVNSDNTKLKGFAMNTNIPESEVADEKASWTGLNLTMSSLGDVVLVFTVTNNMTENLVTTITVTTLGVNTNNNMEIQVAGGTVVKGTPKKMKITFHIKDTSINAGLVGFGIALNFLSEADAGEPGSSQNNPIDVATLPKLTFTPTTGNNALVTNNGSTGEVIIPAFVKSGTTTYSVTEIPSKAFYRSSITSITIPNTITNIGESAFEECLDLTGTIIIPDSVITIGDGAFGACEKLAGVVIGNNVQTIGEGAFAYTNIAGELTIPNSVTTIKPNAFEGCYQLTSVIIGTGITTIEENAFLFCSSILSMTINSTTPPTLSTSSLGYEPDVNFTIYVPAGSVSAYKNDTIKGWNVIEDNRIQAIPA